MRLLVVITALAAAPSPLLGLGDFRAPVRLPDAAPADDCGVCHPAQLAGWSTSLHKESVTNPVFVDGFRAEPHLRCLTCHAPEQRQVFDATRTHGELTRLAEKSPAREGITCTTCHVRQGEVIASHAADDPAHLLRVEPAFASAALCAECHEFEAHAQRDGRAVLTGEPMQTTFSEWRAWGGTQSCIDCHGAHQLKGSRDVDYLRGALSLTVGRDAKGPWAEVASVGVGHRFPTGDVFRRLELSVDGATLATFGRTFEPRTLDDGLVITHLVNDTSLVPGVPVRVRLPRSARDVAVSYHFAKGASPAVVLKASTLPAPGTSTARVASLRPRDAR